MIYDYYKEMQKRRKKSRIPFLIIPVLLFVFISLVVGFYTEYIQFQEIGNFTSVFITSLKFKIVSAMITFLIVFCAIYITNTIVRRNYERNLPSLEEINKGILNVPIALLIGIVVALLTKDHFYEKVLMLLNKVDFGKVDPLFNVDIGYYVFVRPFLYSLYEAAIGFWMFVIVYTLAYYFVLGVMSVEKLTQGNFSFENTKFKPFIKHNLINVAIFFFIKSFSFIFLKDNILYSTFANVRGAGYTDVSIWLVYYRLAPVLLIGIIILSLIFISKGKYKNAVATIAVYPISWVAITLIATFVQSVIVEPSITKYETKYIKNNIQMTKDAYGINQIKNKDFSHVKELTPQILDRNKETKDNIRILDYNSTLISNKQLQTIKNFYTFKEGDIVNYKANGKNSPVFITAREMETKNLPDKSYLSRKFKYTHGYGVVVNPINKVKEKGQIDFIISDLNDNKQKLQKPQIYYGETTQDYVMVNAAGNIDEIDYDGNATTRYSGTGGIKLSFINKILFSLKYADYNILISSFVNKDTKIMINRQIVQRVQKVLPFLTIDGDPYVVVDKDGNLKWIIDAYTTSSYYPYSQDTYIGNFTDFNYIRNSVKIVLDAYNGSMKCYIVDKKDPIIQAYKKIYPEIFTNEEMSEDIKGYMKYPEFLFKIQTGMLKRYHISEDTVDRFFSNPDLWDISKHFSSTSDTEEKLEIEPFYNMIKLPGGVGEKEEFILMRPFSPSGADRHNMVSWLAVRNSFENYGEMVLYRFSENTNILGPYQVAVKINQNEVISQSMVLKGSTSYKGNLMVIPIEESILYVEPLYIRADVSSSTPEIRKIIVGFQKGDELEYGIGNTLDEALADVFKISKNSKSTQSASPNTSTTNANTGANATANTNASDQGAKPIRDKEAIINEIKNKYGNLRKEVDEIGKILDELNTAK